MTLSDYYNEMHWLVSNYADRPDVVQGAGGNVSVKIDKDVLLVKASGREFGEVGNQGNGLVPVFYQNLKKYLACDKPQHVDESMHLSVVRSNTGKGVGIERPSMEVWFHTLLDTYVLHTHSVYVNVLACSQEGSELFRTIMEKNDKSFCIFPYYNPGFELGEAMARHLGTLENAPPIIFLENHGIIVTAESAKECVDIHAFVEEKIKELLHINDTLFDMRNLNEEEIADFNSIALFPDQIIYPEHAAIRAAHRFILKHVKESGLHIRPIGSENINIVGNMESEKHRKNLRKTN